MGTRFCMQKINSTNLFISRLAATVPCPKIEGCHKDIARQQEEKERPPRAKLNNRGFVGQDVKQCYSYRLKTNKTV